MIDCLSTYKIWANDSSIWAQWVKPVLFSAKPPEYGNDSMNVPDINWLQEASGNTMVIVDLPGKEGVEQGIALARLGYRPVPIYNGVYEPGESSIVNTGAVAAALFKGADMLDGIDIPHNAPPAFLLDYDRMSGVGRQPGKYDNRWCVFQQDMPSANFLTAQRITKIIVRSDKVLDDLSFVLADYIREGIKISLCNAAGVMTEVTPERPSWFKSLIYRFKVTIGLTRNAAGGFGGKIPEPQANSGVRIYGIG